MEITMSKKSNKSIAEAVPAKWSIRRFRHKTLTGPGEIQLSFPTEGGGVSQITVPNSDLGCRNRYRLLDTLANFFPVYPPTVLSSDESRFKFIQKLAEAPGVAFELIPERTGFIDSRTFAMYSEV